ncbi:MAG: magnesium transporter [Nitrospinota bacterium]
MQETRDQRLHLIEDSLRRLVRRGAKEHITNMLEKLHAAEVAHVFQHLELDEKRYVFDQIREPRRAADVLAELDGEVCRELMEEHETGRLVQILQEMSADDLTDVIASLPQERADEILRLMHDKSSEPVEDLLKYPKDTAGGIMTPEFLALNEDLSVEQAIHEVRRASEAEQVFYIYVVDERNHLVGVVSLRDLVTAAPQRVLRDVMAKNVWKVQTTTDQEEVARVVSRYNLLAIPVVDEENKLVGIITVDDVIDVISEETTEDILKMAGTREEESLTSSTFRVARSRLPWLLVSWVGGVVALQLINVYSLALSKYVYLAAFIPIIMGMGGNVGVQSSTIVVRGIATGRLGSASIGRILLKELKVGLSLGITYGLMLGLVTRFQFREVAWLGLTVGVAICSAMVVAAVVAALLPLIFQRLNIDPAVATGPFVTSFIDILGILIYFNIAAFLII